MPAVAPRRSTTLLALDPPTPPGPRDFAEVLTHRRSTRRWPDVPIPRRRFASLLGLSAGNRPSGSGEWVSRAYPSGGATYSLEVYPVLARGAVETIAPGIYRYCPHRHGLEPLPAGPGDVRLFRAAAARSAGSGPPPIVLVLTSRFARAGQAYGELAYSLVLKEVGALIQTLHLVGGYLDLGVCALGGGTPQHRFAHLSGTDDLTEPVVGEVMIGPLERPASASSPAAEEQVGDDRAVERGVGT